MKLSQQKCEACRIGESPLSREEALELRGETPLWALKGDAIEREFQFDDFRGSIAFVNAVAEVAEEEGHHPVITLTWGEATITWYTHKIEGLHQNDFIMAAKTDELA